MRDETFVEAGDDEVAEEDAEDEFASYFSGASSPKVIITTSRKPSGEMFKFLENLFSVIPNAYYYSRRAYHVQEIVKLAKKREFTDLLVFNENKKFSHGARVNGLLHVHLPDGPSCLYRLSSLVLTKKIRNHGRATNHHPELILNNFSTRLGHRVGRMFASVFPQRPEFNGRRRRHVPQPARFHLLPASPVHLPDEEGQERLDAQGGAGGEEGAKEEEGRGQGRGSHGRGGIRRRRRRGLGGGAPRAREEDFSDVESDSRGGASRARTKKRDDAPRGDGGSEAGETVKARLQELGPRFTLKLMSIQRAPSTANTASTSTCATGRWTGPDTTGENSFCDETRRRGRDGEGVTRALPRVPSRERSLVVRRRRRRRGEIVGRRKLFPKKTAARVEDPLHTRYSSSLAFARRDPFRRSPSLLIQPGATRSRGI